jgi:hypothetical protein
MSWTRKLTPPIALTRGETLTTLTDARTLILSLPESSRREHYWIYAMALLADASQHNESKLADVRAQLSRALKAEGLI